MSRSVVASIKSVLGLFDSWEAGNKTRCRVIVLLFFTALDFVVVFVFALDNAPLLPLARLRDRRLREIGTRLLGTR